MSFVARCKGCGAEALVSETMTVEAPCDCALRNPAVPWEMLEMVPAGELAGAVEDLAFLFGYLHGGHGGDLEGCPACETLRSQLPSATRGGQ